MNILASSIRSQHFQSTPILISVNTAASVLTLILKQNSQYTIAAFEFCSVYSVYTCRIRSSSVVSLALDYLYLPHYKSPTSLLDMHHLTCRISSLLHSLNLILFTLLLVHLILHISPHHNPRIRFLPRDAL